jgi:ABC-type phosphate/phosphonate transport system substrate-binding protein
MLMIMIYAVEAVAPMRRLRPVPCPIGPAMQRVSPRRLAALLLTPAILASALLAGEPSPVKIGIVKTLFNDLSKEKIDIATESFPDIMKESTQMEGKLVLGLDAAGVAKQLADKQIHLGVFNSFEYAWVLQKHPDFKVLMVAGKKDEQMRASLMVRKNDKIASLADLKGQTVSIPKRTREFASLYLDRLLAQKFQSEPSKYFGKIVLSENMETALDDLASGKVKATLIDSQGLAFYQDLKPGLFNKLKALDQSDVFPPVAIAYLPGVLGEATLKKLSTGLLNANQSEKGKEMMRLWKIDGFTAPPANYGDDVQRILKAYPAK